MAIKGISTTEQWTHFSRFDSAESDDAKTKWFLSAIPVAIRAYLGDITLLHVAAPDGSRAVQDRSATRNIEAVRFGLKGVENFKDPDGNDIKLTFVDRLFGNDLYKVVDDESLSKIPPLVIGELGETILSHNTMSEELRKKLLTP